MSTDQSSQSARAVDYSTGPRVKALRADGILFQRGVRQLLSSGNGPLKFHAEEYAVQYPVNVPFRSAEQSKLDLWFKLKLGQIEFNLLLECKKADPNLKEWIFLDAENPPQQYYCDGVKREGTNKIGFGFNSSFGAFYSDAARELKGEWNPGSERERPKTSSSRIEDACHQISIATQCLREKFIALSDVFPTSGGPPTFFIPIIVTNAKLLRLKIDSKQLDQYGEYSDKSMSFEDLGSVVFLHSLSAHLQPDFQARYANIDAGFIRAQSTKDILVTSPDRAPVAIQDLCKAVAKQYEPKLAGG